MNVFLTKKSINMKKIFTVLAFMLVVYVVSAQQIDRNLVLLEITTGTWCGSCPPAAHMADYLHENGYPVAIIENHGPMGYGDPYANANSVARNTYYSNNLYPTTQIDGNWMEGPWPINISQYAGYVDQRMLIQTSFDIEISGSASGNEYDIIISVTKAADYSGTNLKVRFALTESHIQYNWMGETELNFVNHLMLPNANGTSVNFNSIGEIIDIPLNFTFNNSWDVNNCELVAFIQDDSNKEVLNSAKMDALMNTLNVTVSATPEEICIGETSQLNATAAGGTGTYTYSWTSDPEGFVSDEQNPEVTPLETTTYMLEVSDGDEVVNDQVTVTVYPLPEITLGDWPEELCNELEPPVQLTATPDGGTYSGNNVTDDGIFSPEEATIGWNVITYTYQDENGCENTATDSIFVDQCIGIYNSYDNNASLTIFPNPNSGSFNINSSQTIQKVELINQIGKIVYTKSFGLNDIYINASIERGIYFVKISLLNDDGKTNIVYKKILIN